MYEDTTHDKEIIKKAYCHIVNNFINDLTVLFPGRVDDLLFFDCLISFYFLLIEFYCIFSIFYKILTNYVYYYCILIWIV